MQYQYTPNIWPLLVSSAVTAFLGTYAFAKRRKSKGAASFILSMLVLTLWSLSNAMEMSGSDLHTKLFWANMQYFAYCYSPVTLFALCAEFAGYGRLIRSGKILWLAVLPTIIFVLVWTDGIYGLVRYDIHLDTSGAVPVIAKKYGPVFYVHTVYSYALNFASWFLLIHTSFSRSTVYRNQALSLFFALSLIIFPNVLYVSHLIPSYSFDVTPVFFGPAGLVAAWAIFKMRLFDVAPMAWSTAVRSIDSGIMVIDEQGRILDINPRFEQILGCSASKAVTRRAGEICAAFPGLASAFEGEGADSIEFAKGEKDSERVFEAVFSPIGAGAGKTVGRLVVARDVTEEKRRRQELLDRQWSLAVDEEKARTARDLHDNMGQVLGFINIQAQGIEYELQKSGVTIASERLKRLVSAAQSAQAELRDYIRCLRDMAYPESDFSAAVNKRLDILEEHTGVKTERHISALPRGTLPPHIQFNVQSIVREALNNVEKHARAKTVKVSADLADGVLHVLVEDDGKGFDPSAVRGAKTGFGLDIMRERAHELGGKLDMASRPGAGCRIRLELPIESEENKNEINAG